MNAVVATAERRRLGYPSGWWAMLLLIATEGALFGLLIGSYYYLRFKTPDWPPAGDPEPSPHDDPNLRPGNTAADADAGGAASADP